ncbi:CPBP family intramembrane glutamic endopeptidase [Novosphingobium guangzhouense]|uniref:CPBP family intramembrane glutamic endopeptidase n=1 Tax=Novosphingobium guangzhouense TaxID=1850347 RepID=UPI000CCC7809|nr:type II CAAX endopeptidase family protein [Novosphingobium guangzhouense]
MNGLPLLRRTPVRCLALATMLALLFAPVAIPLRVLLLAGLALMWTFVEAGRLAPVGVRRHGWRATLLWTGGVTGTGILFGEVGQPLLEWLLATHVDYSGYGVLVGNERAALQLLAYALTSAAIGEEVLFRGFFLHQVTAIFGEGAAARRGAILASGAFFGVAHFIQGWLGILFTGLMGVVFAWAWFRSGRNLWSLIMAHALIDIYGIAMIYLGRYN